MINQICYAKMEKLEEGEWCFRLVEMLRCDTAIYIGRLNLPLIKSELRLLKTGIYYFNSLESDNYCKFQS